MSYHLTGHSDRHQKDLQRINTARGMAPEKGINLTTIECKMVLLKLAWTSRDTKQRGVIWSCNPVPGPRYRENHLSNDCVQFSRAALLTIAKTRVHQSVHEQKNEGLWGTSLTGILYSAIKQKIMVVLAAAWTDQEIFILSKGRSEDKHQR